MLPPAILARRRHGRATHLSRSLAFARSLATSELSSLPLPPPQPARAAPTLRATLARLRARGRRRRTPLLAQEARRALQEGAAPPLPALAPPAALAPDRVANVNSPSLAAHARPRLRLRHSLQGRTVSHTSRPTASGNAPHLDLLLLLHLLTSPSSSSAPSRPIAPATFDPATMETLLWTTHRRTTLDARDAGQDALVGFSSGASTDDDGLPHTPPDLPFHAPALKASSSSSQASSRASSRSRPPSTVLEIALAESSLSPFSHRDFSRSPSPPPSPQLASASSAPSMRQDRHRSLPAGFEHIPWISDDDDSDVEGRLSRSLSPPLHDLLSLPPLSPDVDDRDDVESAALSPASTASDLPPSPPRTPSPRRRFASLSGASAAEHDLVPWATSPERAAAASPDRSRSSPSPRRRSSTRSGLPTLRAQLSPPHPSSTSTSSSSSSPVPRSGSTSPDKPVRPTLLRESSTTSRRPALPVSQAPSPPPSPRSRAALQLPTPDDVRARHAATRLGERGRARAVEVAVGRGGDEREALAAAEAGEGLQLSFSAAAAVEAHEQKQQDVVEPAHGPAAAEGDSAAPFDEPDPHSLDYFERHCHSLSLLRLRHALSVATVLASLPPSAPPSPPSSSSSSAEAEPSPSRAAGPRREPPVAHVPGLSSAASASCASAAAAAVGRPPSSRASSSSTPLGAGNGAGNMVSQQYRLYAMGRAKAQRTGGVGYWEGGLAAWELLLMD